MSKRKGKIIFAHFFFEQNLKTCISETLDMSDHRAAAD